MDRYLPVGYELTLNDRSGKYIITDLIGKGASTAAYFADYYTADGNRSRHIIKEFNPCYISFSRTNSGELCFNSCDEKRLAKAKDKFLSACRNQINIRNHISAMNQTPAVEGPFFANNTIYTDVTAYNGATYDVACKNLSMCDRMKVCLSVAKLVKCYHDSGYLCLDIKPENIFVIPETKELLYFIDFDSICKKEEIAFGNSISYTKTWAAPEQLNPYAMDEISEATDIYAIGELVFWSVFERHSTVEEHRGFSVYPFENERLDVQRVLTDLFHRTLRTSVKSRCNCASEIITAIEKLIAILSEKEYVISSRISPQNCIGRDDDIAEIAKSLQTNSTFFVTGFGGIGKSTVVKQFFSQNVDLYDIALYLEFDGDIKSTFATQVNINTLAKNNEESNDEYFNRIFMRLQALSRNKKVLIVIDNFSGKITKELSRIFDNGWNVIVVTRTMPPKANYKTLEIKAISNVNDLYRIFSDNLEAEISDSDRVFVDRIIKKIEAHTLVLELIAKQISSGRISIGQAAGLVESKGFSNISPEKIDYIKDGEEYYDTISNIISGLFDVSQLPSVCRTILKMLSLFDVTGISIERLCELMELKSQDEINQLKKEGWANFDGFQIKLHPVIAETIGSALWTEENRSAVLKIMENLYLYIKLEDRKEEIPRRMVELSEYTRDYGNKKVISIINRQDTLIRKTAYRRMMRHDARKPADLEKLSDYVNTSEKILNSLKNVETLNKTDLYINLQYVTVMAMPMYREDYILEKAKNLIDNYSYNYFGNTIMKMYDRVVYIYTQKGDFNSAYNEILNAKEYIRHNRKNECKALYYELWSTYYEEKLGGAYIAQTEEEKQLLDGLLESIDKSIKYSARSRAVDKKISLTKYLLSKVNVLMRSHPEKVDEIDKLHKKVQKIIIIKHTLKYSEVRFDYWMSLAWYYSLIKKDYVCVMKCIEYAWEIAKHICRTPLDEIDKMVIPLANMCCELQKYDKAEKWLNCGIEMCEEYKDILPYARKRINLMRYALDVYFYSSDFEKCRQMISEIEEANQCFSQQGIYVEIPDDIYEQVCINK